MTSYIEQSWSSNVWVNSSKYTSTYDANNNLTNEFWQTWNGSSWENNYQVSYTYNANNYLTSELSQSWYGSVWVNSHQSIFTYDANNFPKAYSFKYWNYYGTMVMDGDSAYYYHTVLGIDDLTVQEGSITVYPNPTSEQITIETSAIQTASQLSILNLNGQEILTRQITKPKTQLDVSCLPNGVYFIRLTSDKTVSIGKFIKE